MGDEGKARGSGWKVRGDEGGIREGGLGRRGNEIRRSE